LRRNQRPSYRRGCPRSWPCPVRAWPLWSPDARWIVWTRDQRLWLTDTAGVEQRPLSDAPAAGFEFPLAWSPDGKALLYAAKENGHGSEYELRLVQRDGKDQQTDPTRINTYFPQGVSWSPDGEFLLQSPGPASTTVILIERRTGGRVRTLLLTPGSSDVGHMTISRDLSVIVFDNGDPEGDELLSIVRMR